MTNFRKQFLASGYIKVENLLAESDLERYRTLYEDFLSGKIDTEGFRSDLGSHVDKEGKKVKENITQIMCPSRILPVLLKENIYHKALAHAREILGSDMALDFDMLIDKAPHTDTPTPWHQDMAYWIDMPDKRAVSCWVALDEVDVDNGCMWFVPRSHLAPVRTHRQAGKGGGALVCEAEESEAVAVPLKAGSCTFHHGGTIHYSRGNSTNRRRRAYILNFRPEAMIQFERERGFDHTGQREVRQGARK